MDYFVKNCKKYNNKFLDKENQIDENLIVILLKSQLRTDDLKLFEIDSKSNCPGNIVENLKSLTI
jgi:hypothetical protein